EIAVVADRHRQEQLGLFLWVEEFRDFLFEFDVGKHRRKQLPERAPRRAPRRGQDVERRPGIQSYGGEVEDLVADRHAAARPFLAALLAENPERKVLDREIAGR